MGHKTTVIELTIEPADFFNILHKWAIESDFSLHKTGPSRTIYSKETFGWKGWVSAENHDGLCRLEAWLSPKKFGPDFDGGFWKGWKAPVPAGFVMGRLGVFKKQVYALIEQVKRKSKGTSTTDFRDFDKKPLPIPDKSTLAKNLAIFGVINILFGLFDSLSATIILSNSSYISLGNLIIANGFRDIILGGFIFLSSRLLNKGKTLAIWLYGSAILIDVMYSLAMGHKMNYIFIGFGLLFLWQIFQSLKKMPLSQS